jgi:aryl-alcohol dehydrogenase-like predicted oxidoreductase
MKTRKLGYTPLNLSAVGLGTWPFSNTDRFGWGPQNEKDTTATIQRAMELGVNWIDCAPIYGVGQSEETVGRALKTLSKKPIIATKALFMWDSQGTPMLRLDRENVRKQCEMSMKRLGIDFIDMYMIHWPFCADYIDEAWGTMVDLVKEGKVGYLGVSNFSAEQMEVLKPIHPVAFLEPPYSMLERGAENGLLEYCGKNNIGVITYSSLQQGLLTGTPPDVNKLTPRDCRRTHNQYKEPMYSLNVKLGLELQAIAEKYGHTAAQLAIAWNLRRPELTSAITGPRKPSEIEDTVKAADWQLTKEILDEVEKLLAKRLETLKQYKANLIAMPL